jgi:hypothetical protein
VCTAVLRALATALATSPVVRLRPSRRDPVLAQLLVRALEEDAAVERAPRSSTVRRGADSQPPPPMEVTLVEAVAPAAGDELHVYGVDATVRLHRQQHPTALVRGHGTGLGVAVVGEGADLDDAAVCAAADVVPFDQRGCLSPRFVLVEGGADRARAFAEQLHESLRALSAQVPRGQVDERLGAEIARQRSTLEAVGSWLEGPHHAVGLDPDPRALPLPPAARIAHVVPARAQTASQLLERWATWIATVGAAGDGALLETVHALAPRARRAPLGRMQRPPFDGPVDLRQL